MSRHDRNFYEADRLMNQIQLMSMTCGAMYEKANIQVNKGNWSLAGRYYGRAHHFYDETENTRRKLISFLKGRDVQKDF